MSEGGYVRAGVESSYGAGDGTMNAIVVTSISDSIDKDPMYEESIDSYVTNKAFQGGLKLSGSIEGNLRPMQWHPVFTAIFGVSTLDVADYDLTIGSAQSNTLEIGTQTATGTMLLEYAGTAYTSMKIEAAAKEFVKVSADWFAKTVTKGTYSEPTPSTEDPVIFQGATLEIDDVAATKARNFTLNIGRGLKDDNYVLGSSFIGGLIENAVMDVNGNIEFSAKEYDQIYETIFDSTSLTEVGACNPIHEAKLELLMVDPCDSSNKMDIVLPVSVYTKTMRRKDGRDETQKTVDFKVTGSGMNGTIYG